MLRLILSGCLLSLYFIIHILLYVRKGGHSVASLYASVGYDLCCLKQDSYQAKACNTLLGFQLPGQLSTNARGNARLLVFPRLAML